MPRKAKVVSRGAGKVAKTTKSSTPEANKVANKAIKVAKIVRKRAIKVPKAPKAPKVPKAPKEVNVLSGNIGQAVQFYDEGWRHGYIDSMDGPHAVRVRPITGIYDTIAPRTHRYLNTDVTLVVGKYAPYLERKTNARSLSPAASPPSEGQLEALRQSEGVHHRLGCGRVRCRGQPLPCKDCRASA